jgi:ubiquinone/menaquinone biosynthesis C-methylase UbiE
MASDEKETTQYWDQFYKEQKLGIEDIPSQFGVFVCSEFSNRATIVDVGCGSGRDSFFFARHFPEVIGIDGSASAINFCNQKKRKLNVTNTNFKRIDLSENGSTSQFFDKTFKEQEKTLIYARFFIHAIDEITEINFLKIAGIAAKNGASIAVEFRTLRDKSQPKETDQHYRRYVDPFDFIEKARLQELRVTYFVEGFGFAKYRNDDAHIARLILVKNE